MGKRGVGVVFCFIAAILMATRYIAAAIFMSGIQSWSSTLFSAVLDYMGAPLMWASIVCVIIGIGYLVWAEMPQRK